MKSATVDKEKLLGDFVQFLKIDLHLAPRTVTIYRLLIKRYLSAIGESDLFSVDNIRSYLSKVDTGVSSTYANEIKALKHFYRDFLKKGELVESFKFPSIPLGIPDVPSTADLERFYNELPNSEIKAVFLMYATTGLRSIEVVTLLKSDVDYAQRMVIPRVHTTGSTKKSLASFFNRECEDAVRHYLKERGQDSDPRLFLTNQRRVEECFHETSEKLHVKITPKLLRVWFSSEMAELGVADRYVDYFQGRTPRSIISRHYSDYRTEKVKRIYDNAGLRVFSEKSIKRTPTVPKSPAITYSDELYNAGYQRDITGQLHKLGEEDLPEP